MSEQEFESYLRLMGRLLNLSAAQRDRIAGELRDHMEERLAELADQGVARDAAIMQALDEFGDAAGLANDFTQAAKSRRRRLLMRTGIGTIGIAAAIVITSALLPFRHDGNSTAPPVAAAQGDPNVPQGPYVPDPRTGRPVLPAALAAATRPAADLSFAPADDAADHKALRKLDEKGEWVFDNTRLLNVIDFFRDRTGLNFDVNWTALQAAGVDQDKTVTLNLKGVSASKALKLTLDHLQTGVQYVVQDGMVQISTRDDLNRHTVIRIYNCRDLIGTPAAAAVHAATAEAAEGGGAAAPPAIVFPPGGFLITPPGSPEDARVAGRVQALTGLIQDLIEHESWQAAGGTVGSINEFDGLLIVRHTASAHQQIRELLEMLRDASAKAPAPAAPVANAPPATPVAPAPTAPDARPTSEFHPTPGARP